MHGEQNKPKIGDFPSFDDKSGKYPCIDVPHTSDRDQILHTSPPNDGSDTGWNTDIFYGGTVCH